MRAVRPRVDTTPGRAAEGLPHLQADGLEREAPEREEGVVSDSWAVGDKVIVYTGHRSPDYAVATITKLMAQTVALEPDNELSGRRVWGVPKRADYNSLAPYWPELWYDVRAILAEYRDLEQRQTGLTLSMRNLLRDAARQEKKAG